MPEHTAQPRSFAVVTDSTADISPELAEQRSITVVPLLVMFGDETYPDGTFTQAEFFERMKAAPELPSTSQPSVGAFDETYERLLAKHDSVISIHISEKLSGTVASATQAAERFEGKVHVFDSLNLSGGLALQVFVAAAAAAEGLAPAEALERLERARARVRMIVGLDSLENLAKGGRIGKVSAFLGSMLNLKVTLTVDEDGAFLPVKRSRGEKVAMQHTLEWVAEKMGDSRRGSFAIGHAMTPQRAENLSEDLKNAYDVTAIYIYEAGSVISTHTGTGWGVALLPED